MSVLSQVGFWLMIVAVFAPGLLVLAWSAAVVIRAALGLNEPFIHNKWPGWYPL